MKYILSDNVLLLVVNIILVFTIIRNHYKSSLLSSKIVIPILNLLYIVIGNVNLLFFQTYLGWYRDLDPIEGNRIALIALIFFNTSVLVIHFRGNNKIYTRTVIHKTKFDLWIKVLTVIAVIFNSLNYAKIGGILLFKSGLTGYERFDVLDRVPFPKLIILSSFLICPIIVRLYLLSSDRIFYGLMLLLNIVLAGGLGHRHFIFMPALTAIVFLYSLGAVSKKVLIIAAITFPILVILVSSIRGDASNVALSDTNAMFGNEYRDYLRVRKDNVPLQYGKTMAPVILNIIPKQVYELLDLKKSEYAIYSAYILQEFWGNASGQRAGIWGEFYLNFGDIGVIICFTLFSFLAMYIDKYLFDVKGNVRGKFIFSYWFSLLIFSIMGSWATIGDDISSYGLYYTFFYFLCFTKIRKNGNPITNLNKLEV